jgi:hypothetical protein
VYEKEKFEKDDNSDKETNSIENDKQNDNENKKNTKKDEDDEEKKKKRERDNSYGKSILFIKFILWYWIQIFRNWLTIMVKEELNLLEEITLFESNKYKNTKQLKIMPQTFSDNMLLNYDPKWLILNYITTQQYKIQKINDINFFPDLYHYDLLYNEMNKCGEEKEDLLDEREENDEKEDLLDQNEVKKEENNEKKKKEDISKKEKTPFRLKFDKLIFEKKKDERKFEEKFEKNNSDKKIKEIIRKTILEEEENKMKKMLKSLSQEEKEDLLDEKTSVIVEEHLDLLTYQEKLEFKQWLARSISVDFLFDIIFEKKNKKIIVEQIQIMKKLNFEKKKD